MPPPRESAGSIPVIIDCDPGIDDSVALLLALASPELDIRAVTVSGGNVPLARTLRNALGTVALAGATVPVHAGAEQPLLGRFTEEVRVHGADGLGGARLPEGAKPAPGLACDAIRRLLRDTERPITLVGIAPATNLALALLAEPPLVEQIGEIVLMAGAWGEGNGTPAAEFNAWSDPEALAVLLACGRPVRLATLELTAQAAVTPERLDRLRRQGHGACLRAAAAMLAALPALPRAVAGRRCTTPVPSPGCSALLTSPPATARSAWSWPPDRGADASGPIAGAAPARRPTPPCWKPWTRTGFSTCSANGSPICPERSLTSEVGGPQPSALGRSDRAVGPPGEQAVLQERLGLQLLHQEQPQHDQEQRERESRQDSPSGDWLRPALPGRPPRRHRRSACVSRPCRDAFRSSLPTLRAKS